MENQKSILEGGFRYNYGGWTFEHVGKNLWKIYPDVEPNAVIMTGANLTKELFIAFTHRLIRMHFFHTDGGYAPSTDDLSLTIERSAGSLNPLNFEEYLYDDDLIRKSRITLTFEPIGIYDYEASLWKFTFNTTSADVIFPVIYIENRSGWI